MIYLPPLIGLLGLVVAFILHGIISSYPAGEGKVADITRKIQRGAAVFMRREYSLMAIFIVVLAPVTLFTPELGWKTMVCFLGGAVFSSVAGFIGMYSATRANVRTAIAARDKGAPTALTVAFFGGAVMGLTLAALGLIGIGLSYILFGGTKEDVHHIHGFAMGASVVALFARVGGGIFTKTADVGADLVGKVEAGIPEDDPRNPGVIADNVGDNVGDVAGMGSDIFESYCNSMIATMAIAMALSTAAALELTGVVDGDDARALLTRLPLLLVSAGMICSLIGVLLVKIFSQSAPVVVLRIGTIGSTFLFMAAAYFVIAQQGVTVNLWLCVVGGAAGGIVIGLITEYFTAGKPVEQIAKSAETGVATVIIKGLAVGQMSVAVPLGTIAAIILMCSTLGGLYGVGIGAVGMLATIGITMAIDAYGPVADNAGGIAEMGGMGPETREITDSLDELGNTTAAIGKGFAIGAAALAALAIIAAYVETVSLKIDGFALSLSDADVLAGMFIGVLIPYVVASITMTAVGDAAFTMVNEIRRQFREIPGLMEGTGEPDTDRCIDIATTAALKKMMLPGSIAVFTPLVIGFGLGAEPLGGMLAGALLGCVSLALLMSNAGGAWDNAKKFIERGNFGGKGSEAHKATVVGDTVGDPLKDTSGPSMNILINVMGIVSLVIAPLLVR
ncbi:MAG: sodium-translocating pyrophosphatase [Candidatus Sumerlaeia bacterium]|nr:sodium-translocating pyrophosphatase [Candidatus Sumerlaeia bacterium]